MTITTADKLKEATMTLDPKALEAALPCPFCGATPHYNVGKVRTCQLHGDPIQDHVYVCPHGCARKSGPTKRRALDTWNTRTRAAALPPVDVAGLVNWSCDERNRDKCRNAHGCHCKEIANLATALERVARERDEARAIIRGFMACSELDIDARDKDPETLALETRALRFINGHAPATAAPGGGEKGALDDEDTVACEQCSKSTPHETAVATGDGCYLCAPCFDDWQKTYETCNHKWKPYNMDGEEGAICELCSGFMRADDAAHVRQVRDERPSTGGKP